MYNGFIKSIIIASQGLILSTSTLGFLFQTVTKKFLFARCVWGEGGHFHGPNNCKPGSRPCRHVGLPTPPPPPDRASNISRHLHFELNIV